MKPQLGLSQFPVQHESVNKSGRNSRHLPFPVFPYCGFARVQAIRSSTSLADSHRVDLAEDMRESLIYRTQNQPQFPCAALHEGSFLALFAEFVLSGYEFGAQPFIFRL